MSVAEFTDMVSCFIRVAWAAAAGKLQLVGSLQPVKETNLSDPRSSVFNCREASVGSMGKSNLACHSINNLLITSFLINISITDHGCLHIRRLHFLS